MNDNYYNIYIDIDSLLDFRLKTLSSLGLNIKPMLIENSWFIRMSDNILGISKFTLYSIIENEMDAMFSSCHRTDITEVINHAFLEGYNRGITSGADSDISLYVDMKSINMNEKDTILFKDSISSIIPSTINVHLIEGFKASEYDAIIMYDSSKFLDNLIINNTDFSSKKLYTPFLVDTLFANVKSKGVIEKLLEFYTPFIDIDFPPIKHFSVLNKIKK